LPVALRRLDWKNWTENWLVGSMSHNRLVGFVALGALTWFACTGLQAQTVPETGPLSTLSLDELPGRMTKPVVSGLALDPTGRYLAAAGDDHVVRIWDTQSGTLLRRLEGHTGWVRACAFAPTGPLLATAGQDCQVCFWDITSGQRLRQASQTRASIAAVVFSPDGRLLAAGGFESAIRLIDATTGRIVQEMEAADRDVRALAFSGDGQFLAAAGSGGRIRIAAVDASNRVRDLPGDGRAVQALAFRADGARLASAGLGDAISLWDLTSGSLAGTLPARPGKIMALTYCGPDRLAAGGSLNTIRIFDPDGGREILRLAGHTGSVSSLVFDPASGRLISGGYDTTVRFWMTGN